MYLMTRPMKENAMRLVLKPTLAGTVNYLKSDDKQAFTLSHLGLHASTPGAERLASNMRRAWDNLAAKCSTR